MLVECICGESKFAVDAKAIGFNGRLVKCGLCAREWFQESKLNILEKRLIEVDQKLQAKEIEILEQQNDFRKRVGFLEKNINKKKLEQENQDSIQTNINALEQRTREKESESKQQDDLESRFVTLEKAFRKMTLDSITKNSTLEKSTFALEEQLKEESYEDRLLNLEKKLNINFEIQNEQDDKEDFVILDKENEKKAEKEQVVKEQAVKEQEVTKEQEIEDVQKEVKQKSAGLIAREELKPASLFAREELKPFEIDSIQMVKQDGKNTDNEERVPSENKVNNTKSLLQTQKNEKATSKIGGKDDSLEKKTFLKKLFSK